MGDIIVIKITAAIIAMVTSIIEKISAVTIDDIFVQRRGCGRGKKTAVAVAIAITVAIRKGENSHCLHRDCNRCQYYHHAVTIWGGKGWGTLLLSK